MRRSLNKTLWKCGIYATLSHKLEKPDVNNTDRTKSPLSGRTCEFRRVTLASGITELKRLLLHINRLKVSLCILRGSEHVQC